jgi:hypothetical protein
MVSSLLRLLFDRSLEAPDTPVGVADGHLLAPEMRLLESGDYLEKLGD